ncbi:alcohol oxidase [Auriculariales sp. MPI-PUGE-AT-0066]|nr:alcohol oxidase [Auriculariales sp. MPI-PUGE-AT-0066]
MRVVALLPTVFAFAHALTITNSSTGIAGNTYDFVIVGSGPGGLSVASRLAQRAPKLRILVIEAGSDQRGNTVVEDPANAGSAFLSPGLSKLFFSAPQHDIGRQLFMVWGQTLGGSSTINGMQWDRGQAAQYDAWEQLGNPGWNWASMKSFMKKSEAFKTPTSQQAAAGFVYDASAHGFNGRVSAGMPRPLQGTALQFEYQDAVSNATLGGSTLPTNVDFCTGNTNGAGLFQYAIFPASSDTTLDNKRCNAAEAYIYPFMSTFANLTILTDHLAKRMLLKTGIQPATATGVEFIPTAGGDVLSVKVKKEVIVAGGAIASAAFLELSGVGDPAILSAAGVPLVVNLTSVGTGLQDQFFVNFEWEPATGAPFLPPAPNALQFVSTSFLNLRQIVGNATASSMGSSLVSSIPTRAAATVASGGFTSVTGLTTIFNLQANLMLNKSVPVEEFLGGPASFGQIPSTNTWIPPIVNPNLFTDSFDINLMIASVRFARRIASTAPIAARIGVETIPGFTTLPEDATDEQIQAWIKTTYLTAAHPVGTLAMLPKEMGGVVSPKLQVYGLGNVRVSDASIIPIQLATHPQATVYGVGEKAAEIIIAAHNL